MIRSGLILMIKDLAGKGKSAYAIGQEIGISKNTARKYMEQADQQHGLKGMVVSIVGPVDKVSSNSPPYVIIKQRREGL